MYSAAAYCEGDDVEHWNCGESCSSIAGVARAQEVSNFEMGAYGYVAYNMRDNQIVSAFRGSDNIVNWI